MATKRYLPRRASAEQVDASYGHPERNQAEAVAAAIEKRDPEPLIEIMRDMEIDDPQVVEALRRTVGKRKAGRPQSEEMSKRQRLVRAFREWKAQWRQRNGGRYVPVDQQRQKLRGKNGLVVEHGYRREIATDDFVDGIINDARRTPRTQIDAQ